MGLPKRRTSSTKRDKRRAHDALTAPALSTDSRGETHIRHHMSPDGFYRGRRILTPKDETEVD